MTTVDQLMGPERSGDLGQPERVDSLVAAVVRRQPDAPAVAAPDAHLTYGELFERSGVVADHLAELGVGGEALVGLCLPRSAALVVAALGVLRAGAAYVALDPDSPSDRVLGMLEDCAAQVVITPAGSILGESAPLHRPARLELAADGVVTICAGAGQPAGSPVGQLSAAEGSPLAYVVYTSGSTGAPKGVLLEHAGLLNLVAWHREAFSITAADRGTQIASPGFDAVVWEIWPYLVSGASLHIPPAEVRADPPALRDWLVAEQVTVTFLPTALAEQVFRLAWPAALPLRFVLTGGDRLRHPPPPHLPFEVVNNYGVSEGTVVSTSGPARSDVTGPPTIGRPIEGVQVAVVGEDLNVLPPGEVGELLVGGPCVARGYLHQPELTAAKFVSPVWAGLGQRWYRTGDLVRQRLDCEIEFLGRLDDQVQLRGVRIEPAEVSARLDQHSDVVASVVVAVGEGVESRLHAYLLAEDAARRPGRRQLQEYLSRYLPEPMVPSSFSWIADIPHTPNGKVDRAALPAPVSDEATDVDAESGGSELEKAVAAIVAELLGLKHVAPQDNFFLLGGHSLLGAQLIARVGDEFGISLGLRALFDNPTSTRLSAEVERLILAEMEGLTDEQASQLLDELGDGSPSASTIAGPS